MVENEISKLNSHLQEIESFIKLIEKTEFTGTECYTVGAMYNYFHLVKNQLLKQLDSAAQKAFEGNQ